MKLLLHILLVLFTTSALYGGFSAAQIQQAKAMVAKNPSLLNSPQAQKAIQQHQSGSVANGEFSSTIESEPVENSIDTTESSDSSKGNDDSKKILGVNKGTKTMFRLSPLKYKSNDAELYRIKSGGEQRAHKKLQRFSKEFFRNKNKISQKTVNAPNNYIINRGDTITFWVYGATNQQHKLKVNSQGNINIPEIGPVRVAGEKYNEVKELLTNYLSSSYKNSDVVVDLNSYSTAQVTLTGFVNAPGIFNTSSVSSVKDILIEAHGVSEVGSVRNIQVKRNGQTIATIDYYHLLTSGLEHGDVVLQPNDTIYVPKAYGLVRLEGAINKEAIYEIERGESLGHILRVAGGLESSADGMKIHIKRYDRNRVIKYMEITLAQARSFRLKDGDEIYVGQMNETNERYVTVIGNVVLEGKKEINGESIQLSRLLRKEMKNGKLNSFFLENSKLDYAVVKRIGEDTTPQMFNINLKNILDGLEDFTMHNRDTLYVYNQLDTSINPYVTISQAPSQEELRDSKKTQKKIEQDIDNADTIDKQDNKQIEKNKLKLIMKDGKHLYTKGMTIKDLIYAAGIKNLFDKSKIKIVRHSFEGKGSKVILINFQDNPNYALQPYDKVYLFDLFETNPIKMAYITGEVVKPGKYTVEKSMTLKKFIDSAGGLSEKAYPKQCEIIRYHVENGEREKKIFNIAMKDIETFLIQPHDEINIRRIPNWYERKTVTIEGEVKFPGTYVIDSGEKLSSVIQRAGGYTNDAFLYGAVFTRKEIAKLQQDSLKIELSKLKEQVILASLRASGSKTMGTINISESIKAVESLITEAERLTPLGRISINLGYNENSSNGNVLCDGFEQNGNLYANNALQGTPSNLTLKDGDKLFIPSFNDTVVISGEVMNPMASIYLGDSVRDYISKSGGLTEIADTDHIYVLHANGEAQKATVGSYLFSSNRVDVKKGDVVIVPKKLMFQRGIDVVGEVADIFYKLTLTVAAMHTVGAL